jgi:hypothetical protein
LRRKHLRIRRGRSKSSGIGIKAAVIEYCLIASVILGGVVWGAKMAGGTTGIKSSSFGILIEQILSKESTTKGFPELFASSFFSSALLLAAAFALGLCAVGAPGHAAVAIFKGAGIGYSMGYIYIGYGIKGFAVCALFILPWAIITSLAVMIACREGIVFSLRMAYQILPGGSGINLWPYFRDYCSKFLTCFILALAAAAIEALSTMAFSILFFS